MRHYLHSGNDADPEYENAIQALDLTGGEADQTFEALSSPTSREMLKLLYEDASTPPQLAVKMDTSSQNVHYHLGKLKSADLIESTGTTYSSRGTEMDIYAPTSEAIVLLTGREPKTDQIRTLLKRFLSGLVIVALVSLVIDVLLVGNSGPAANGSSSPSEPLIHDLLGIRPVTFFFIIGFFILMIETWARYRRMNQE